MKQFITLLAVFAAVLSCEKLNPENGNGLFIAEFADSGSPDSHIAKKTWSVGDRVVLSNCCEDLFFEDGILTSSVNGESFTVTSDMISNGGSTLTFTSSVPVSGKYAIFTAGDFSDISSVGKDGAVVLGSLKARKELNYIASAISSDRKFKLRSTNNYFSLGLYDKRIRYVDVSVGYSAFELEIENIPATFYFPLPLDEDISDGIYAYAYDESCEKIFTEHYQDISFKSGCVLDLGAFIDFGEADGAIIKEILSQDNAVESTYNLEGELLKRYLDEVQYDDDYSYTRIKDYVKSSNEPASVRPAYVPVKDLNNPERIYLVSDDYDIQTRLVSASDKQAVYNLIPGRTYKYGIVKNDPQTGKEILLRKGCFATEGRVRVIKTSKYMHNVRDVGGWEGLDGKHIKYGVLFRGSEMMDKNQNLAKYEDMDYEALVDQAGIDFDMDFRTDDGAAYFKKSPFGLEFIRIPLSAYDSIVLKKDRQSAFRKAILTFIKNAKAGKCTYVHCQGGADRTGTFVFYIEGLLGVSDSDLCKDYEITSFYYHKERNDPERYLPMIKALRKLYGTECTIGEAIYKSAVDMGLTDQDIRDLRSLMLE